VRAFCRSSGAIGLFVASRGCTAVSRSAISLAFAGAIHETFSECFRAPTDRVSGAVLDLQVPVNHSLCRALVTAQCAECPSGACDERRHRDHHGY